MVYAINDIFHFAFTWRSQYHTSNAWAFQVLSKTFRITPFTRIVND
jgi:hypothetical protein